MWGISMRQLQKLSARTIQELPHAMPIKNGRQTVAVLVPVKEAAGDDLSEIFAGIDRALAELTPEQRAALDKIAAERGIE